MLKLCILLCVIFYYCLWNVETGKVLVSHPGVDMADYRFGLGDPYIVFYERENYRGKVYFHRIALTCTNLEEKYTNWASSVDLQRRCVKLCEQPDCKGYCQRVLPDESPRSSRGASKLQKYGLNDKVASVKFCY